MQERNSGFVKWLLVLSKSAGLIFILGLIGLITKSLRGYLGVPFYVFFWVQALLLAPIIEEVFKSIALGFGSRYTYVGMLYVAEFIHYSLAMISLGRPYSAVLGIRFAIFMFHLASSRAMYRGMHLMYAIAAHIILNGVGLLIESYVGVNRIGCAYMNVLVVTLIYAMDALSNKGYKEQNRR